MRLKPGWDGLGEAKCKKVKQARRRARIAGWLFPYPVPLRTNMTPDHRLGSPGVRLTKTPLGHACFKPALLSRSCPPMISRDLSYFFAGHRGMESWRSVAERDVDMGRLVVTGHR